MSDDICEIFEILRTRIDGYGYLKWNEVAMMKADMMNVRRRWMGVDPKAFQAKCIDVGMTTKEAAEMVDYLKRTQDGRRLVPDRSYRDFRFEPEPPPPAPTPMGTTSREW